MKRGLAWLPAARRYFVVIAVGNLMWEFAQLPLYTLWKTDTAGQITYAVFHCTAGDVLIAGITLAGSLLLLGTAEWPRARFFPVAAVTLISGTGITAYIEHLSIARGIWAYSDLMPMLPGTSIGLSPLAQWIVIPALAFVITRSIRPARGLDLPTMGITTSKLTPDSLAFRSEIVMSDQQTNHPQAEKRGCGCGQSVPAGVTSVVDPVCGMKVDPATSKHRHEHGRVTYHFCCGGCRSKFAADPAKYLPSSQAPADPKTTTDPVCGMKVDPATSKHHVDHGGTTYHFCSAGCETKFAAAPESYLKPKAAEPAKPGATYTCPCTQRSARSGRVVVPSAAWRSSLWRSAPKRCRNTN